MKQTRTWLDNKVELRDDRGRAVDYDEETKYGEMFERMVPIPPNKRADVIKYGKKIQRDLAESGPDEGRALRGHDEKHRFELAVGHSRFRMMSWAGVVLCVFGLIVHGQNFARMGSWLLRPLGLPPAVSAVLGIICVLIAILLFGWIIKFTSFGLKSREDEAHATCFKRLLLGLCGGCEFDLSNLPEAADGCKVCSECGAAWKVSEWKTSHVPKPIVNVDVDTFMWNRRVKVFDDRGAVVRFMAKHSEHDARRVMRSAFRKHWCEVGFADVGMVIWIALSAIILCVVWVQSTGNTFEIVTWLLGGFGVFLWLMLKTARANWVSKKSIVVNMVKRSVCPACEEKLDSSPCHADGRLLCSTCGCAWNKPDDATMTRELHSDNNKGGMSAEASKQVLP